MAIYLSASVPAEWVFMQSNPQIMVNIENAKGYFNQTGGQTEIIAMCQLAHNLDTNIHTV